MARITNHFARRDADDKGAFTTTWEYCAPVDQNNDRLAWQYHTNARLMSGDRVVREEVHESAPNYQVYSPIDTKRVGPNHCLTPAMYWPFTPWVAIASLMDAYINYNHVDGWNGEQSVAWFRYEEPLTPKISPTRTQNKLSWAIDAQKSSMGTNSKSDQCRLRWYVQRVVEGKSYPNITKYDTSTFGAQNTGDWQGAPNGFKGAYSGNASGSATVEFTEQSVSPDRPYAIRIVAYNDGFCGASKPAIHEHVFAKPNKPTISQRWEANPNEVSFAVDSKYDWWHPVEKLQLQRQTASVCDPNGTWTNVGDPFSDPSGIKMLTNVNDTQPARIPPTDKATWYRVITTHDHDSNQGVSNIWPSSYIAKPAAPTITACTLQSDYTVQLTVNRNSDMNVETYVAVKNISKDLPADDVPAYKVEGDLTTGFLIQSNGQPKQFDVNSVYEVSVYNKVINSDDLAAPYAVNGVTSKALPTSDPTTTEVRGSIGAVAKAALGAITIDSVTTTPGGKGVMVEWHAEPDELNITYDDRGTLIEWTDADGGWQSTEAPRDYKRSDGANDAPEDAEGEGEAHTGAVVIDNLTEGKTYQIRLRRYVTLDGKDGYGTEATTSATPWSTPTQVVLQAPAYTRPGESVRYSWTFTDEDDTPQSAAQLTVNGVGYAIDGSAGSFVLDVPDSLAGETLIASVRVACNGGYSEQSNEIVTQVAEPPTCTAELAGSVDDTQGYGGQTLTALPLEVTVGGTGDQWRVRVTSSGGARSPEPEGGRELADGETAVADLLPSAGTHALDGSRVIGGGNYDLECVCVDTTTGMESEPVTLGFSVAWETPAVIPTGTVTIANRQATITPAQGDGADEGEKCRIWRKTADGYQLACERALWDTEHIDRVPAYGSDDLAYVIEAVSTDGDHRWSEVPYSLAGEDVRITYGGGEVALPWNLQPSDTYSKGFERRSHMDGQRAGYWQPGIDHDWTCSAELVKGSELTDALREVGRHDGICYVRGPHGVAFAANVDVSLSAGFNTAAVSVDMTCAEVEDDGTYAVTPAPGDAPGGD